MSIAQAMGRVPADQGYSSQSARGKQHEGHMHSAAEGPKPNSCSVLPQTPLLP